MEIIRDLNTVHLTRPTVLTVGSFDGIHRGHQHLIGEVVARAREIGAASALVTLHPHPKIVLRPDSPVQYLSTIEERLDLLAPLGLNYAVVLPFSLEYSQIRARDFVQMLLDHLNMKELVCGADFALGYKREGNVPFLEAMGTEKGFSVRVVEPQRLNGQIMSSSRIREMIAEGDLEDATELLGRYPSVRGRVIRGDQRGRKLGFPTANLAVAEHRLIPANGIYAVRVKIGDEWHKGAASIGIRPTFGGTQRTVEVHVLDFDDDLYDQVIEVQFVKRLREEMKFSSADALVAQMRQDVAQTRQVLRKM
ncbi:MAG: bifunctional riboflavin kinase/FAD synthetase [Chloroflexi bacterium]|nr:bifunctional riboflavin kinase/FAD synthetase [Chloroflexota bacterium]MCL5950590.1 bifunctional riboflavin kinase/FAD synthetase [Chloroflexota bacterium]